MVNKKTQFLKFKLFWKFLHCCYIHLITTWQERNCMICSCLHTLRLVKWLWLCLRELWHFVINTAQRMLCSVDNGVPQFLDADVIKLIHEFNSIFLLLFWLCKIKQKLAFMRWKENFQAVDRTSRQCQWSRQLPVQYTLKDDKIDSLTVQSSSHRLRTAYSSMT